MTRNEIIATATPFECVAWRYEAARKALAEARAVDEVREIHDEDKNLAHRARNEARKSEEEFETFLVKAKKRQQDAIEGNRPNRTSFTADNEWFTPAEYIALARAVMGTIDLDAASHPKAQETVQASRYFTIETDGLKQKWAGKVWLNPPYSQPEIVYFIDKLLGEFAAKRVKEAILLTHNFTDASWFHKSAKVCSAVCFTRGRIRFVALDGSIASPTQGQAFFYFGPNPKGFMAAFRDVGFILVKGAQ